MTHTLTTPAPRPLDPAPGRVLDADAPRSATRSTPAPVPVAEEVTKLLWATGATVFVGGGTVLVPHRRSKGVYVPMLCELGATTVGAAVAHATTFVEHLDLYPGKPTKLIKGYAKIEDWCAAHGIDELAQLVDDTAAQLICDLAGLEDLTCRPRAGRTQAPSELRATATKQRQRAHRIRNLIISLRSASVLVHRRHRKQRLTADSLALGLPDLPSLVDRKGRPLTDEEILLGRFLVEIDRAEGALPRPLLAYLVAEAGIRPVESTALETGHCDDPQRPTTIEAKGAWNFGTRTVELHQYAATTMPAILALLRPGDQPLTYAGSQPGTCASTASLELVIGRHLRRAGICDPNVTAKSLSLWRVQHALSSSANFRRARTIHGGATANVLADLKLDADEIDLAEGVVHLRRSDTHEIAYTVSSKGFYDRSITHKRRHDKNEEVS